MNLMAHPFRSRIIALVVFSSGTIIAAACANNTSFDPGTQQPEAGAPAPQSKTDSGGITVSGKAVVQKYQCESCHTSGAGELAGSLGPVAGQPDGTQAFAANLTPDKDTGIGNWTDDQIISAIRTGVDDQGEQLCPTMERFSQMSDAEVHAVVTFLRQLPAVNNAVPESVCPPLKTSDDDDDGGDHDKDDDAGADSGVTDANPTDSAPTDSSSDAPTDTGTEDAADAGDGGLLCSDFAAPDTHAGCTCKAADAAACQPNGCYGGYYCYTPKNQCWSPSGYATCHN